MRPSHPQRSLLSETLPEVSWGSSLPGPGVAPPPSEQAQAPASLAGDSAAVGHLQLIKSAPRMAQHPRTPHSLAGSRVPAPLLPHRNNPESTLPQPDPGCPCLASQEPAPTPGQGTWMGQGLTPPSGPQSSHLRNGYCKQPFHGLAGDEGVTDLSGLAGRQACQGVGLSSFASLGRLESSLLGQREFRLPARTGPAK